MHFEVPVPMNRLKSNEPFLVFYQNSDGEWQYVVPFDSEEKADAHAQKIRDQFGNDTMVVYPEGMA